MKLNFKYLGVGVLIFLVEVFIALKIVSYFFDVDSSDLICFDFFITRISKRSDIISNIIVLNSSTNTPWNIFVAYYIIYLY